MLLFITRPFVSAKAADKVKKVRAVPGEEAGDGGVGGCEQVLLLHLQPGQEGFHFTREDFNFVTDFITPPLPLQSRPPAA